MYTYMCLQAYRNVFYTDKCPLTEYHYELLGSPSLYDFEVEFRVRKDVVYERSNLTE